MPMIKLKSPIRPRPINNQFLKNIKIIRAPIHKSEPETNIITQVILSFLLIIKSDKYIELTPWEINKIPRRILKRVNK